MLSIFIGIAAFTLMLVFLEPPTDIKKGKTAKTALCLVTALAIAMLTDAFALIAYTENTVQVQTTVELVETRDIIALQDTSSESGRFFLGSGSYKSRPYYTFYYNTEYGAKYDSIRADSNCPDVYINTFSEGSDTPHIDEYCRVYRKYFTGERNPLWFSVFAYLKYGQYKAGDIIESGKRFCSSGCRYEIFIPEGSILEDFNIDLN